MPSLQNKIKDSFQAGQFEQCLLLMEKLSNEQWSKALLEMKGYAFQKTKNYSEALEVWNGLILQDQMNADYYENRGISKFHLRYKSCLEDMDKSIALDAKNGYRYACRAYIKDKVGDTEGSIEDYKKALELDPDNEITLNNLGLAEEKLGYTQRARERFKKTDQLLGIDKHMAKFYPEEKISDEPKSVKNSKWTELKKMLSSKAEFKSFIKDAKSLFSKNK